MRSTENLSITRYNPSSLFNPTLYAFSHIVRISLKDVTEIVHISGQGGENSTGVLPASFEQQCDGVFQNIQHCLAAAEMDWTNIAQMRILVVEHNRQKHHKIIESMQHYFSNHQFPACTLIPVSALALPTMLLEIEVTAYRFEPSQTPRIDD